MRPETIVPDHPEPPFPLYELSQVISGFGRGSAELGIPTANIPVTPALDQLGSGIYYGWCRILPRKDMKDTSVLRNDGQEVLFTHGNAISGTGLNCLPMVMSIGWNPFYQNKSKTAEIHVIHNFSQLFYGTNIELIVLGFIRPELDYTTKGMFHSSLCKKSSDKNLEALIDDIHLDINTAKEILHRPNYAQHKIQLC